MGSLVFHVHAFVPDADGQELELREALLVARGFACELRAKVDSQMAFHLVGLADELAGNWVFADAPIALLELVRDAARDLVNAARKIEKIERGPTVGDRRDNTGTAGAS